MLWEIVALVADYLHLLSYPNKIPNPSSIQFRYVSFFFRASWGSSSAKALKINNARKRGRPKRGMVCGTRCDLSLHRQWFPLGL